MKCGATVESVAAGLVARGREATVEHPGFVQVVGPYDCRLNVGTANVVWGFDVVTAEGDLAFSDALVGEHVTTEEVVEAVILILDSLV